MKRQQSTDHPTIERKMKLRGYEPLSFDSVSLLGTMLDVVELIFPRLEVIEETIFLAPPLVKNPDDRRAAALSYKRKPSVKNKDLVDSFNWIDLGDYFWRPDPLIDEDGRSDGGEALEYLVKQIIRGWRCSLGDFRGERSFSVFGMSPKETGYWIGVGFKEVDADS